MDQPLISVIVPVYNVEKYLDQCVGSIVSQTYRNLEIILVDDGSPDNSGALCDAWAGMDSRIRVIHQENAGGGAARNRALDAARGNLIAFVDSDDYIAPWMFGHLYDLLSRGADIAECSYVTTQGDDAVFAEAQAEAVFYSTEEALTCHIRDTVFRQLIWNKLYRRETIGGIRFPVGTKIDDEFFIYQVLGNARKLILSDAGCYAYRQQPGSVMHQKNPVKVREGLRARQERLEYLQAHFPGLVEEARRELLLTCVYSLQAARKEQDRTAGKQFAREITQLISRLRPVQIPGDTSPKQRLLLTAAQKWPEAVAAGLNFLIDIHILT